MATAQLLIQNIYTPTFEIKVEDRLIPLPIARSILNISVTQSLNPPNQFSFQVYDPLLELIEKADGWFDEGKRVEIGLGFLGKVKSTIIGEITALTANFSESAAVTVRVEGFDLLHRLTRGTTYRKFEEPDSDIVAEIAAEMGLKSSTDKTAKRKENRTQNYISNLNFLQQLAEEDGYFLWVEGETLYFKRDRPAPNTIQLEWGKTLIDFSPRLSTAGQVEAIEVRRVASACKQSMSATEKRTRAAREELSPSGQKQIALGAGQQSRQVIENSGISSPQEAGERAEREMRKQEQSLITGSGTCVGSPDLQVGSLLNISQVGRFSGTYRVEQVTHSLGSNGYQTSFQGRKQP